MFVELEVQDMLEITMPSFNFFYVSFFLDYSIQEVPTFIMVYSILKIHFYNFIMINYFSYFCEFIFYSSYTFIFFFDQTLAYLALESLSFLVLVTNFYFDVFFSLASFIFSYLPQKKFFEPQLVSEFYSYGQGELHIKILVQEV